MILSLCLFLVSMIDLSDSIPPLLSFLFVFKEDVSLESERGGDESSGLENSFRLCQGV